MGHRYSIRHAVVEDVPGILACLQLAFEPFRSAYTKDAYSDTVLTVETLQQRFSAMQIYVAVSDTNIVVGTIACSAEHEKEGHLRGMAVHPEWQGNGIAAALLQAAETALVESGCVSVSLDTTAPLKRAIHFYEKNGFCFTGKVMDFFGMPLYEYVKKITI